MRGICRILFVPYSLARDFTQHPKVFSDVLFDVLSEAHAHHVAGLPRGVSGEPIMEFLQRGFDAPSVLRREPHQAESTPNGGLLP